MNPIILHDNRFADATPTASATADGYDARHIADLRTFTFWQGSGAGTFYLSVDGGAAKNADALGLAGHNLGSTGASVSVESSADGGSWAQRLAPFTPADDRDLLRVFSSASARHWRLKIVAPSAAPRLAVAVLGSRLAFPFPPDTPYVPYTEDVEEDGSRSKAGHLLGQTIRFFPIRINPRFSNFSRSWVLSDYQAFWDAHARWRKPFFYAWDLDKFPAHAFFVKHSGNHAPSVSIASRVDSFTLDLEGVRS